MQEFLNYWYAYHKKNPDQRLGQSLMNAALMYDEVTVDVAHKLIGTELDPFYRDSVVVDFLEKIAMAYDAR